ncbi:hypothetical protein D9M69_706590 [compost metagenome]
MRQKREDKYTKYWQAEHEHEGRSKGAAEIRRLRCRFLRGAASLNLTLLHVAVTTSTSSGLRQNHLP